MMTPLSRRLDWALLRLQVLCDLCVRVYLSVNGKSRIQHAFISRPSLCTDSVLSRRGEFVLSIAFGFKPGSTESLSRCTTTVEICIPRLGMLALAKRLRVCLHACACSSASVPGSHSLTHILEPVFCVDRGAAQQLQAQRHNDTTDLSFYEQVHVSASVQRELSSPYKSATSPVIPVFDV